MSQQTRSKVGRAVEPRITEFGPCRVIGVRYAGKNGNGEVAGLWESLDEFISRAGEDPVTPDNGTFFGLCRCLPDAKDGSFEYIAGIPAQPGAPVPEGMVEASIAKCTYAAFPVDGIEHLIGTWAAAGAWLTAHPEWKGYCDSAAGTCDCADHPSFELYPPEFADDGRLAIYMPVISTV